QEKQTAYPGPSSSFYIGAKGGYLFKNSSLADDPAFFLDQGYFGELNLGWRSSSFWGWQLNLGRLNINRDLPSYNGSTFKVKAQKVMENQDHPEMWNNAQMDDQEFIISPNKQSIIKKENLGSWYAMTGPKFWIGKDRLQGFVSLNAGLGMTKFGYYYIGGVGNSSNTLQYNYTTAAGNEVGPVDLQLVNNNYMRYGMTQEAANSLSSSGTELSIDDKAKFHFLARGTVGLEYFISHTFSLNASASYWYQFLPDWNAQKDVEGPVAFNGEWPDDFDPVLEDITSDDNMNLNSRSVKGEEAYQYTRDYSDQNLGHISANIGFKVWFGNSKKEEAPQPNDKDLFITVKDEPTGYALSGVAVTVYKDGEPFYSGVTNDNGAIPTIGDVAPGNYTIKGELNNIETSTSHIEESDFSGESRVIKRTLSHKDLRFTLAGQTLYEETGAPFPDVATKMRQVKSGESVHQVSDKDGECKYQLDPDTDFTVYAEHEGYFSNRKEITTKDLDRSKTLYVDLRLELGELKEGAEFELKNIYYDFDKSDIRPDAAKVLNDLYNMMVDNPA